MDKRRTTIYLTYKVDQSRASRDAILDTVDWHMGQLIRGLRGLKGVSGVAGEVADEGQTQGNNDASEADNAMGTKE